MERASSSSNSRGAGVISRTGLFVAALDIQELYKKQGWTDRYDRNLSYSFFTENLIILFTPMRPKYQNTNTQVLNSYYVDGR